MFFFKVGVLYEYMNIFLNSFTTQFLKMITSDEAVSSFVSIFFLKDIYESTFRVVMRVLTSTWLDSDRSLSVEFDQLIRPKRSVRVILDKTRNRRNTC